jgi:hypothetical protein
MDPRCDEPRCPCQDWSEEKVAAEAAKASTRYAYEEDQ